MKTMLLLAALVTAASYFVPVTPAEARCEHSYDRASDGSRCGGRAADQRKGGRGGY